jgi:hypothetical protein
MWAFGLKPGHQFALIANYAIGPRQSRRREFLHVGITDWRAHKSKRRKLIHVRSHAPRFGRSFLRGLAAHSKRASAPAPHTLGLVTRRPIELRGGFEKRSRSECPASGDQTLPLPRMAGEGDLSAINSADVLCKRGFRQLGLVRIFTDVRRET